MNRHIIPAAASGLFPLPTTANNLSVEAGGQGFDIGRGAYVLTPADFPHGCLVVFDPSSRRRIATGECRRGDMVTLPLDVPLCGGCDQPLDEGVCADCRLVFVEHLGPGRIAA